MLTADSLFLTIKCCAFLPAREGLLQVRPRQQQQARLALSCVLEAPCKCKHAYAAFTRPLPHLQTPGSAVAGMRPVLELPPCQKLPCMHHRLTLGAAARSGCSPCHHPYRPRPGHLIKAASTCADRQAPPSTAGDFRPQNIVA
jgi:hypothetical protein